MPVNNNTIAAAICIEWLEILFKPDQFGRAGITLSDIKSSNIRASLNQIRKGVSDYKRIMMSEKALDSHNFEAMKEFASYKMEVLTELAMAFIPLDEDGCTFLTNELLKAVQKLSTQRHKEAAAAAKPKKATKTKKNTD